MKLNKILIALIIILVLGLSLRIFKIDSLPLYGDELTMVYDSYSILKTGMDQTGERLPLTFSMGAGRPGGYVYFSIPFVSIFGPSELGVRSLSVLSFVGIALLLFLLGRKIFNKEIGLIAAFVVSLSPWSLSLSRGGFEAHFALFLALLGVVSFIYAKEKPGFYIISAISFALTIHTYPTYKLTLPFILISLFWFGGLKGVFSKKIIPYTIIASVILIIASLLSMHQTLVGGSEDRFSKINLFSREDIREEITQKINAERGLSDLPGSLATLFHNKYFEYILTFLELYADNLSADFLFFHGDGNPRHNMVEMGGFYIIEILTIILGLIFVWKFNKKIFILLLSWILITPIAAAFIATPHALRSAFLITPLILFSSAGLYYLFAKLALNLTTIKVIVVVLFFIQFMVLIDRLYFLSNNKHDRFWSGPAKLISEEIKLNQDSFDVIIVSDQIDNIEYAIPVYLKMDPSLLQKQGNRSFDLHGLFFKKLENIYIGHIPEGQIGQYINGINGSVLYFGPISETQYVNNASLINGKEKAPSYLKFEKH